MPKHFCSKRINICFGNIPGVMDLESIIPRRPEAVIGANISSNGYTKKYIPKSFAMIIINYKLSLLP